MQRNEKQRVTRRFPMREGMKNHCRIQFLKSHREGGLEGSLVDETVKCVGGHVAVKGSGRTVAVYEWIRLMGRGVMVLNSFFFFEDIQWRRQQAYKPCLARAAVTSWASVESWGDSRRLMLPAEDRRGEVPPVSAPGEWVTTISAPWSTRALADSRKLSLWLSIWHKESLGQVVCSTGYYRKPTVTEIMCGQDICVLHFTITLPPPGVWLALSMEPTLA